MSKVRVLFGCQACGFESSKWLGPRPDRGEWNNFRGERLGIQGGGLFLMAETSLERILDQVEELKPAALVVDSVQTVFSSKFASAPGSISQVREVATQLLFVAKGRGITTFLIGHVTKDGSLAGPKSLAHVGDAVLYFEGENRHDHRIVRAVKNVFGP